MKPEEPSTESNHGPTENSPFSSRHTLAIQGNVQVSKNPTEKLAFVFLV